MDAVFFSPRNALIQLTTIMNKNQENQSTGLVEVFNFNQKSTPIRVQVINGEPWFVAKDVCDVLGIKNNRDAIQRLDDDEKATSVLPTQFGDKEMWLINESGLYVLALQSRKPEAHPFRKWVTAEVLPSIRKRGYYGMRQPTKGYYIDARDIPYSRVRYNGGEIRMIEIDGECWYSINDVNGCIGSRTESSQNVRRLNAKRVMARKIWLYGVTQPGWFTTLLGVRLLLCASAKHKTPTQLMLDFDGQEG